jgi:undecaprenyl diphosphate synthase
MTDLSRDLRLDPARLPRHVAIIMDGNGRWARRRGLPRLAGHRAGTDALRRVIEACVEFGVPMLTIYAFSTENWKRPPHEVRGLMFLLEEVIERQLDELDGNGVCIRHVGWLDNVPTHLGRAIERAVARTAGNSRLVLNVAFNYGGRAEIVRAVRRIVAEGIPAAAVDDACVEAHLETAGLPDPDLVIRTSGEMRLSNFLLWQGAYAELYCTDTLWPDFDREALWAALASYAQRERRFGRVAAGADGAPAPARGVPVPPTTRP